MGHFHSHSHGAGHHHDHHHEANQRVLVISFALIFSFMLVEAAGGWLTKSLALLSDAGHMLSDAFALGLSLFALTIGKKGADANKTFGYRRFEILAALVNGASR